MSGWLLRDWKSPERTLVGTLTKVYNAADGDTNLQVVPVASSADLLRNLNGVDNENGLIECEINVTEDDDGRTKYGNWVTSLIGLEVTAKGVFVEDEGHQDKTELHPMDIIVARVDGSRLPGDWMGELARQRGLELGTSVLAYRYAAASDDRAGVFLDGAPLAQWSRTTSVSLEFPPRPAGAVTAQVEVRGGGARNSGSNVQTRVNADGVTVADLNVTCKSANYDGPGFDLGEVVTFWTGSRQIAISDFSLTFGLIGIGESVTRTLRISNPGGDPIQVSVPDGPGDPAFSWLAVPQTRLDSGQLIEFQVEFSPLVPGAHRGVLTVNSDAEGSPHVVTLSGQCRSDIPQ